MTEWTAHRYAKRQLELFDIEASRTTLTGIYLLARSLDAMS